MFLRLRTVTRRRRLGRTSGAERRGAGGYRVSAAWSLTAIRLCLMLGAFGKSAAVPALRLAARRDGRPDAGPRAHPRRHDGDRRRLHDRALRRAVRLHAGGDGSPSPASAPHRASSPRRSRCGSSTSRRSSPTPPSASSASCSSASASAPSPACSTSSRTRSSRRCSFLGSGARDARDHGRRTAGHAEDGRAQERAAATRGSLMLVGRSRIAGIPVLGGLLLQGRDPLDAFLHGHPSAGCWPGQPIVTSRRGGARRRGHHRFLHVAPHGCSRSSAGRGSTKR